MGHAALPDELVGIQEIASMLSVPPATVRSWRSKYGILPEPIAVVSKTPVWFEMTIREWAEETGRI